MNEYKWSMLFLGIIMVVVLLMGLSTARAHRAHLKRVHLPVFVGQFASGCIFGFIFPNGVFRVLYLASVAVIFLPNIVWMLRLPKD